MPACPELCNYFDPCPGVRKSCAELKAGEGSKNGGSGKAQGKGKKVEEVHAPAPPPAPACLPGQVSGGEDAKGHCCWPNQVWSEKQRRCIGTPACPADRVAAGYDCPCPDGRTAGPDTRDHCCYEGQVWSTGQSRCVGVPLCPTGMQVKGENCEKAANGGCPDDMVFVPGGTFLMGSPEGEGSSDEHPGHRVTLGPYCIDRTEVTVAAYRACVSCTPAAKTVQWKDVSKEDVTFWSQFCNGGRDGRDLHPINCVDWSQADVYCRAVGKSLPSEAQWELAARGIEGRTYPWGAEKPSAERVNACGSECVALGKRLGKTWKSMYDQDDHAESTAPVGSYPAGKSPYGALDMAGNVWEWTADWHGDYSKESVTDPPGPAKGEFRVVRGGSWFYGESSGMRASDRDWDRPAIRFDNVGSRCARGAK